MRQLIALIEIGIRSAAARPGTIAVIILGTAGAVAVLCFFLAISEGLKASFIGAGSPDRVLIMRRGADTELTSSVPLNVGDALISQPEIARSEQGKALYSREILRTINIRDAARGTVQVYAIRGVGDEYKNVRPEIHMIGGRFFVPGTNELIVGESAMKSLGFLRIGDDIPIKGANWRITGVFSAAQSSHESELLADRDALLSFYQAADISSATAKLVSASAFTSFKESIESDHKQRLEVQRESDYYKALAKTSSGPLRAAAIMVGGLMVLAAVFASMNSMQASVSARRADLKTLSVLGFGGGGIVVALVVETIAFCWCGASFGALLARFVLSGTVVNLMVGADRLRESAFSLKVTNGAVVFSILCGIGVGLLSGVPPALRAVRLNTQTRRKVQNT